MGSVDDATRLPHLYDEIYHYLKGMRKLPYRLLVRLLPRVSHGSTEEIRKDLVPFGNAGLDLVGREGDGPETHAIRAQRRV